MYEAFGLIVGGPTQRCASRIAHTRGLIALTLAEFCSGVVAILSLQLASPGVETDSESPRASAKARGVGTIAARAEQTWESEGGD